MGDVTHIYTTDGALVARYVYDAWGKVTIVSDTSGINIATVNPFRYRSYYYDTETELYYLQSRYYNPDVGRFINRDNIKYVTKRKLFNNLFAYCSNNSICNIDTNGRFWGLIIGAVVVIAIALSLNGCSDSQDSTDVGNVESADDAEYELYLKVHHVAFGNYHTCLVIVSDLNHTRYISVNDKYNNFEWLNYYDSEDSKFFTIGAGGGAAGFVGTLEARYNRSKDKELEIAVEFTKLGAYNADKIQKIINYHEYYMSHKNPIYEARPDPKDKSYNCNSYTHGLLNVVNISCDQSTFKQSNFNTPGWSKPLPAEYFGA